VGGLVGGAGLRGFLQIKAGIYILCLKLLVAMGKLKFSASQQMFTWLVVRTAEEWTQRYSPSGGFPVPGLRFSSEKKSGGEDYGPLWNLR